MRIRFVAEAQNSLTGNTKRKIGDVMDIRDDYGASLVSKGYAVDLDAQPEPVQEAQAVESSWEDVHTNTIRAQARDAGVWLKGMSRDDMIAALTAEDEDNGS